LTVFKETRGDKWILGCGNKKAVLRLHVMFVCSLGILNVLQIEHTLAS